MQRDPWNWQSSQIEKAKRSKKMEKIREIKSPRLSCGCGRLAFQPDWSTVCSRYARCTAACARVLSRSFEMKLMPFSADCGHERPVNQSSPSMKFEKWQSSLKKWQSDPGNWQKDPGIWLANFLDHFSKTAFSPDVNHDQPIERFSVDLFFVMVCGSRAFANIVVHCLFLRD